MRSLFPLVMLILTLNGCSDNMVYFKPLMYTDEPQDIFANSVKLGGEVLSEGGMDILEYGIVYSTNYPPTINNDKIVVGNRVGRFSNIFSDFLAGTTYYYTAFGTNSEGTGYGQVYEFTTMAEAPCNPLDNYIDVTTNYVTPQDGYFTNTTIEGYSSFGGDFILIASKGYWSQPEVLEVHFKGDIADLMSGVYITTSSIDYSESHHEKTFLLDSGESVYVKRIGNAITVTLCDVDFDGVINGSDINV